MGKNYDKGPYRVDIYLEYGYMATRDVHLIRATATRDCSLPDTRAILASMG